MASIRRTLSPVPRPGALMNGEAVNVSSPLSRSSTCAQNHASLMNGFGDSHSLVYKAQGLFLDLFSRRTGRPLERSKFKVQVWRKSLSHFLICFMTGILIGVISFISTTSSSVKLMSNYQDLEEMSFKTGGEANLLGDVKENVVPSLKYLGLVSNASKVQKHIKTLEQVDEFPTGTFDTPSLAENSTTNLHKFLIVVTPTYARPFQTYYLNRLSHTLKKVPSPLLWIVVEPTAQTSETADLLRRTGLMYRHLVCDDKNLTGTNAKVIGLRNVALSHIETHRLDGIVYFADDDNIYADDLFEQVRQIRRFGTWTVAKLTGRSKPERVFDGPVCYRSEVIGWQTDELTKKYRRFHADISGIAFNSTELWDPNRWNRRTLGPIRQRDTVQEELQVSSFIEQLVEDESQMECLPSDNSMIMVWNIQLSSGYPNNPQDWLLKTNLDVVVPLSRMHNGM